MSGKSKIEWTDVTWNPTVGCTRVSAGCDHCYAFDFHDRRMHAPYIKAKREGREVKVAPQFHLPFSTVQLLPQRLRDPLHWRTPRRIFVDSMSDLFHEDVPDAFIAQVFAVMALARQHTFQILTKRPERMRAFMEGLRVGCLLDVPRSAGDDLWGTYLLPLPNVWLGTSVEDQAAADARIPHLLKTPAAVRFLSCEPLLGPVDLSAWLGEGDYADSTEGERYLFDGGEWPAYDGPGRPDLENEGQADHGTASATTTGGAPDAPWLSSGARNDQHTPDTRPSAPPHMASLPWTDSSGHDGESHQRKQAGQPAGKSGAGDVLGTDTPHAPRAETRAAFAIGREERHGEADGAGRRGNSPETVDGRTAEFDSQGLRRDISGDLQGGAGRPLGGISWCIVGGESGKHARPMSMAWAADLINQCREADVAVFMKQLGSDLAKTYGYRDRHGGDIEEFPDELRIREFPKVREAVTA